MKMNRVQNIYDIIFSDSCRAFSEGADNQLSADQAEVDKLEAAHKAEIDRLREDVARWRNRYKLSLPLSDPFSSPDIEKPTDDPTDRENYDPPMMNEAEVKVMMDNLRNLPEEKMTGGILSLLHKCRTCKDTERVQLVYEREHQDKMQYRRALIAACENDMGKVSRLLNDAIPNPDACRACPGNSPDCAELCENPERSRK